MSATAGAAAGHPSGGFFPDASAGSPASSAGVVKEGAPEVPGSPGFMQANMQQHAEAELQCFAAAEEYQRFAAAAQMQMLAAAELQNKEESNKRSRVESPPKDVAKKARQRSDKDKMYDADVAEEGESTTTDLVKKVKIIQRSSPRGYHAWDSYCQAKGSKTKDPRLHHEAFLQDFIDSVVSGTYGDVPGAIACRNDGQSVYEEVVGDEPTKAIFIAGLPKTATEEELRAHFGSFGELVSCRLKLDTDGSPRGMGEVEYANVSDARKVLENFNYNIFQGRFVTCLSARRNKFRSKGQSATAPG